MGSVIGECECPNCHYEHAISDYYYKVDIEYIFCQRCGYSTDWEGVDTGDEDSEMECIEKGKFGCLHLAVDGRGSLFGLDFENSAKELIERFKAEEYKDQEGRVCNFATITFKKNNKWMLMDLLTKKIYTFDEYQELEKDDIQKEEALRS